MPASHSGWEVNVLGDAPAKKPLPKSLHHLYKPRDGGERGENYFYGFFFFRSEKKIRDHWHDGQ